MLKTISTIKERLVQMKKYILIGIFGMGGAICRYGIGHLFNESSPWGTLIVNLTGCFLLPFIFVFLREIGIFSKELVTAIGTGFIGAFTTFSTFTMDIIKLTDHGKITMAVIYLFISLAGGLIAAAVSVTLSNLAVAKYIKKED